MIIIPGAPALSAFRQRKLLVSLKQAVPTITNVKAEYLHFADISQPLSNKEADTLKALMQYGPKEQAVSASGQLLFWLLLDQVLFRRGQVRQLILHTTVACKTFSVLSAERHTILILASPFQSNS